MYARAVRSFFFRTNLFSDGEIKNQAKNNEEEKPDPEAGQELFPLLFTERYQPDDGSPVHKDHR
jgi:hypothetical protein